jgi:hypothetical protein
MTNVTSASTTVWLAERWAAFRQLGGGHGMRVALDGLALIIEAIVLMTSLELNAAPPPEPAPDDAPTTAPEPEPEFEPELIAPQIEPEAEHFPPEREANPERARKTGLGAMIAGAAIGSFAVPAVIVSSMLTADFPNAATGGILGVSAIVMVTGAAVLVSGVDRYKYSPCGSRGSKRKKNGVGMMISGTALTSLGASTLIVGGVGAPWNSPFAGALLGVGGASAASGIALLVTGAVRRQNHPCLACTRLSPLVSFDARGGHAGIVLRF